MRNFICFFISLLLATSASAFFKPDLEVTDIMRLNPSAQMTNASTVTFRVKFSEKVKGVDVSDFLLTTLSGNVTGIVSGISNVGKSPQYDVVVTSISNSGTIRLDLKNSGTGIISDKDGSPINGGFIGGETYIIDKINPVVSSITRLIPLTENISLPATNQVTFKVTFSENVKQVDMTDFELESGGTAAGTISALSGIGAVYEIKISTLTGIGTLKLNLKSSGTGITDLAGNAIDGGFTNGEIYTLSTSTADITPPSVSGITRQNPLDENVTIITVTFAVNFSEDVTGVDISDFSLTTTASASGTIISIIGSGSSYSVTVNSITGTGSIRLDLNGSGTNIIDASSNAIVGGFTTGETYNVSPIPAVYGFTSVSPLSLVDIGGGDTQHKPQGKTWYYAGKWWAVMPSGGTKIFRLDGTTWTETSTIFSGGGRADCWVDGNLVHILIHRNTLQSPLISLQYNAATNTYIPWVDRPGAANFFFPVGSETATLTVDGSGRMWVASADNADVQVWSSIGNYSSWSGPITIATGILDDDICAITKLPGKIGVMYSNQVTGLFGFKTHDDGADPTIWSSDEVPASQSAIPGNARMADDHINIVVASDGTLYSAVKTSYTPGSFPIIALLIRRPDGTWDKLHTVSTVTEDGTQPIVVVNEVMGKVKVIYSPVTGGGDIVYKESLLSNISFGAEIVLMSGGGSLYNYATSTHQPYNPDVVILATKIAEVREVVSVLASDATLPITRAEHPLIDKDLIALFEELQGVKVFPTIVKRGERITIQSAIKNFEIIVTDNFGRKVFVSRRSSGTSHIETGRMSPGMHYVTVNDGGKIKTVKIIVLD